MNLIFLLFVGPILYGVYGLIAGRLPVTQKRSLTGAHARKYSIAFIVLPLVFASLTGILAFALPLVVDSQIPKWLAFYMAVAILPLALAILLGRAQKLARRLMYQKPHPPPQNAG